MAVDLLEPTTRLLPFADQPPFFTEPEEEIIDLDFVSAADDLDTQPSQSVVSLFGTTASILLHFSLLATLANMTWQHIPSVYEPPIHSEMKTTVPVPEEEEVVEYEMANPNDREFKVREVINAASTGLVKTEEPKLQDRAVDTLDLNPELSRNELYDIPEGIQFDDRVVVKGTTGEALIQLESALDRVTWEIAQNLRDRKVLVVWLLDASGSLEKQRAVIAKRLKRIYGELDALEESGLIPYKDKGLLSAVVSFGERTQYLTTRPTDKFEEIEAGFNKLAVDETGKENVFRAVHQVLGKWKHHRVEHSRQIMLVTVTDEAGDDYGDYLEQAIARARRYGAKAYVIGPSAVFGRQRGYVSYRAPENGKTYQLPVDIGPETPVIEHIEIPFWYGGPQYRHLSAGYGPYALTRLVSETGGIYFMTNMTTTKQLAPLGDYDSEVLMPFVPDYSYGSPKKYLEDLRNRPLRSAIIRAAALSHQTEIEGTPSLRLRVQPNNFRQVASDAQLQVARSQYRIDVLLSAFPKDIDEHYQQEPSARWRMTYNLAYGRLLAQKVRCLEYNHACAHLKNNMSEQDVRTRSNLWIFKPDDTINYAKTERKMAAKAVEILNRIIDEAPGTPWAVLARRELRDPLGMRIVEQFIPPPPPPKPNTTPAPPQKKRLLLAPDPKKQQPLKPKPKPKPPVLPKL